mmetsp:Transcript_12307/g.35033  ORF Transcript_12307/g.35033 Transcript_12307/m.35033 type:complete len:539 (-) Transcript_12307:34-1650(-)
MLLPHSGIVNVPRLQHDQESALGPITDEPDHATLIRRRQECFRVQAGIQNDRLDDVTWHGPSIRHRITLCGRDDRLHHGHLVLCQCPGFVRADRGGAPHRLARRQHPDKVVVLDHFVHGVGQRDGHREWQTLWDGNDHDSHGEDEEFEGPLAKLAPGPPLVLNNPTDHQHQEAHDRHKEPNLSYCRREHRQFLLQRRRSRLPGHQRDRPAPLAVGPDGQHDRPAAPLAHLRPASQPHVALRRALFHWLRLTSKTGLVGLQAERLHDGHVRHNLVSGVHHHDIANNNVRADDNALDAVPQHLDIDHIFLRVKLLERPVFRPVVPGAHQRHHRHRNPDGHTLHPGILLSLRRHRHAKHRRYQRCSHQHDDDGVLEVDEPQVKEALWRHLRERVCAEQPPAVRRRRRVDALLRRDTKLVHKPVHGSQTLEDGRILFELVQFLQLLWAHGVSFPQLFQPRALDLTMVPYSPLSPEWGHGWRGRVSLGAAGLTRRRRRTNRVVSKSLKFNEEPPSNAHSRGHSPRMVCYYRNVKRATPTTSNL